MHRPPFLLLPLSGFFARAGAARRFFCINRLAVADDTLLRRSAKCELP
jgi:hypothetical protein